jgi:hypothetical protein
VIAGAVMLPGKALAGWGNEVWGVMIWGDASPLPGLGFLGLAALIAVLAATATWTLRRRRTGLALTSMLVLLAIPLAVAAGTLTLPNTFLNGTIADANQVNANFDAVKTEVDDNDGRITTLETNINASTINSGTLSTNRYDAYSDLAVSGRLDNNSSSDLPTRGQGDGRWAQTGHGHGSFSCTNVTLSGSTNPGTNSTTSVTCSSGYTVTGGGCDTTGGPGTNDRHLIETYPVGNGWRCAYHNSSGSSTMTHVAYARCCRFQ